jgi:hypothetical protein
VLHACALCSTGSYPAAVQILAALHHRTRTGEGSIIGQHCAMYYLPHPTVCIHLMSVCSMRVILQPHLAESTALHASVLGVTRCSCTLASTDVSMTDNAYALMSMSLATHSATEMPFSGGRDMLSGGVSRTHAQARRRTRLMRAIIASMCACDGCHLIVSDVAVYHLIASGLMRPHSLTPRALVCADTMLRRVSHLERVHLGRCARI